MHRSIVGMVYAPRDLRRVRSDFRSRPILARSWALGAGSQGLHGAGRRPASILGGVGVHEPAVRRTQRPRSLAAQFLEHANGIAIVRAYTSSAWFHRWAIKTEMMLFPRGKTKFVRPDGSIGRAPGHGIVLLAMGSVALDALARSSLGWCTTAHKGVSE
jgi:hypothetical protein